MIYAYLLEPLQQIISSQVTCTKAMATGKKDGRRETKKCDARSGKRIFITSMFADRSLSYSPKSPSSQLGHFGFLLPNPAVIKTYGFAYWHSWHPVWLDTSLVTSSFAGKVHMHDHLQSFFTGSDGIRRSFYEQCCSSGTLPMSDVSLHDKEPMLKSLCHGRLCLGLSPTCTSMVDNENSMDVTNACIWSKGWGLLWRSWILTGCLICILCCGTPG